MTFCRNCGSAVEGQFCPSCGQPIAASAVPPSPPPFSHPAPPPQPGGSVFSDLFDFSFTRFVTARIIKVLYVLGIICMGLMSVMMLIGGMTQGGAAALLLIIIVPLMFFLGVIYIRVLLEVLIVIFRIAENTGELVRRAR